MYQEEFRASTLILNKATDQPWVTYSGSSEASESNFNGEGICE